MKKHTYYFLTICFALTMLSVQANSTFTTTAVPAHKEQAGKLVERLNEIKNTDKTDLSGTEKKQLRTEVLSIEQQLKSLDGGIYLSVGAIIIILLILILVL